MSFRYSSFANRARLLTTRFRYDWADFIRTAAYYGVYDPGFGSWYIVPGNDDYNGNQLKQELMVHRESSTGDIVQLNMLHGTHYMAFSSDTFPVGKTWGPWLWYLVGIQPLNVDYH